MIAIDWGTSSLRGYRLDAQGRIVDRRRSGEGALASQGRFREVLLELATGWDDALVLMCGMVGGRGGWLEVPYVDCPADLQALAAGLAPIADAPAGRQLWCAAGVADRHDGRVDVMRGEETQVAALFELLGSGTHLVCLPGTHSKWVTVQDGRIREVATAMTGEVYGLLRQHSLLGRSMPAHDPDWEPPAFDAGLDDAGDSRGLLQDLFGVRTAALFARFPEPALPSYLSGLLIGHELGSALAACPRAQVHLLGSDRLLERYGHALARRGVASTLHPEDLAAGGMFALARARGLA
jgi:2-dehydro-3-deoxygalactonokinase